MKNVKKNKNILLQPSNPIVLFVTDKLCGYFLNMRIFFTIDARVFNI